MGEGAEMGAFIINHDLASKENEIKQKFVSN